MEFSHKVGNGHVLLTPAPEASGCRPDDALTCLLFLFRWITHIDSLDDIYHLRSRCVNTCRYGTCCRLCNLGAVSPHQLLPFPWLTVTGVGKNVLSPFKGQSDR